MANKKIVWVEDDEEVISAFQPYLKTHKWEVFPAPSAKEGKALAQKVKPDLIIMDIIMEGQHGYAAIKDIKSEPVLTDVPIIVFSGITHRWGETTASRQDALLSEADEFVDKSEGPDVLLGAVTKYLGAQVA